MTLRVAMAAACASLTLIAAPTLADDTKLTKPDSEPVQEKSENAEPKAEKPKAEKKICKRFSTGTGSRQRTKICRTPDEWRNFNKRQRSRSN